MEVQTRLFLQRDFWVKSPHTAQGSVQHPALLLLEKRRTSESDENRGVCEASAYALKNSLSRVEGPEPVRGGNRLGFSVVAQERAKAARPGGSPEPKNQARVCEGGNCGGGLAYFSAFSRKHSRQHGRTSADDPRLPAPHQPQRYQPVLASDFEDQAACTREVGRCDSAQRIVVCQQVNSHSIDPARLTNSQLRNRAAQASFAGDEAPNGP